MTIFIYSFPQGYVNFLTPLLKKKPYSNIVWSDLKSGPIDIPENIILPHYIKYITLLSQNKEVWLGCWKHWENTYAPEGWR